MLCQDGCCCAFTAVLDVFQKAPSNYDFLLELFRCVRLGPTVFWRAAKACWTLSNHVCHPHNFCGDHDLIRLLE